MTKSEIKKIIASVHALVHPHGDKASDYLPHYNGGRCEICGHETIDHCLMCGAPQCCPHCCQEARDEAIRDAQEQSK